MTLSTIPNTGTRQYRERRPGRPPSGKRLAAAKEMPVRLRTAYRRSLDPCDNSNDSGVGFDNHSDKGHNAILSDRLMWTPDRTEAKRPRIEVKLEHEDDINDGYSFPETIRTCKENNSLIRTAPSGSVPSLTVASNQHSSSGRAVPRCVPICNRQPTSPAIPLTTQLTSGSRFQDVTLTILKQPEQQHRARYQTEGSRGAVKDREGNGFPIVQLNGYYKPATLQVFIGTDVGKVSPHMFYQACKVSGKNSTPCIERKIDGTCVIELQLDPSKEMSATCDCVGILKERNVDVEHRFPDQLGNRSKKKSTRCRMIFRTTITLEDGTQETLQACSQPIVCTQPPGVPEICKKSLSSCPASGGLELFVLGKNFLKDTKVFFQQIDDDRLVRWEQAVVPDKEYLQQTHFVCVVPPYHRPDVTEPVSVRLCVVSSGKTSESHPFVYTPVNGAMPSVHAEPQHSQGPFFNKILSWSPSTMSKREQDLGMMPPPESSLVPLSSRRPSISIPSSGIHSPPIHSLKQEYIDESSQNSMMDASELGSERFRHLSESSLDVHPAESNMSLMNENSVDMMHHSNMSSDMIVANENSNLSINDNSMEVMVRRNSMSRSSGLCENSMDVNTSNSNLSPINEDSCATMMSCNNAIIPERMLMHQQNLMVSNNTVDELKVMDLRMKMPMATVADLANTTAPSLATLQNFGVTEALSAPLPAQSAQSVENFLTNIESKTTNTSIVPLTQVKDHMTQSILNSTLMSSQEAQAMSQPVFLRTESSYMPSPLGNEAINIVAKSEAAAIAEQTGTKNTTISTLAAPLGNPIGSAMNAEKLNEFINSTVESHMISPRSETNLKDTLITSRLSMLGPDSQNNPLLVRDVMLSAQSSLMAPAVINSQMHSPVLGSSELPKSHSSPNLLPEVIMNSQISPTLLCRNPSGPIDQDPLLAPNGLNVMCSSGIENEMIPSTISQASQPLLPLSPTQGSPNRINALHSPVRRQLGLEPEKAVLMEAAADLLHTQQKLSELERSPTSMETKEPLLNKMYMNMLSMQSNPTSTPILPNTMTSLQASPGNTFIPQQLSPTNSNMLLPTTTIENNSQKSEFVVSLPAKEMKEALISEINKKAEDGMLAQSFTSLTENELINFINPSCFDQV